jgi:hypothetical protein
LIKKNIFLLFHLGEFIEIKAFLLKGRYNGENLIRLKREMKLCMIFFENVRNLSFHRGPTLQMAPLSNKKAWYSQAPLIK